MYAAWEERTFVPTLSVAGRDRGGAARRFLAPHAVGAPALRRRRLGVGDAAAAASLRARAGAVELEEALLLDPALQD